MIIATQYRCIINGKYRYFLDGPYTYLLGAECSANWLPVGVPGRWVQCPDPFQCFDAENINKANCPKQRGQLNIHAERVGEVGGAPLNVTASIEGEVKTQKGKLVSYYCTTGMTLGRIEPDTFTGTSGKMIQLLFFCQKAGQASVSASCTGNDGSKLTAVSNPILCQGRPPTTVTMDPKTMKVDSAAMLAVRITNAPAGLVCRVNTDRTKLVPDTQSFTADPNQINQTVNVSVTCLQEGGNPFSVDCSGQNAQASGTTQVTCTV